MGSVLGLQNRGGPLESRVRVSGGRFHTPSGQSGTGAADDGKHARSFSFACEELSEGAWRPNKEGGVEGGGRREPKGGVDSGKNAFSVSEGDTSLLVAMYEL